MVNNFYLKTFLLSGIVLLVASKKFTDENKKPAWAKKDIRDYTDADLERLLDQWEEDEEPLEPHELPEHLRPSPTIDFSKVDMSNPESVLKLSKKGKTLMMFVTVSGDPSRDETEEITKLWQTGLWNNHVQADRFLVDDNRAIFMFKDGALAWDAKDFLVQQERCQEVMIEQKSYPGVHTKQTESDKVKDAKKSSKKKTEL